MNWCSRPTCLLCSFFFSLHFYISYLTCRHWSIPTCLLCYLFFLFNFAFHILHVVMDRYRHVCYVTFFIIKLLHFIYYKSLWIDTDMFVMFFLFFLHFYLHIITLHVFMNRCWRVLFVIFFFNFFFLFHLFHVGLHQLYVCILRLCCFVIN